MYLLALDTSSSAVSVALLEESGVRAERTELAVNRHGERLAPLIAAVLADCGVDPRALTALAAGVGPGPFTGLRVGLVTALALADALDLPSYPVCSLDALAAAHGYACVALSDARRHEVYWAGYDEEGTRTAGPEVTSPAELAARLPPGTRVVGAGAARHRALFPAAIEADPYPTAGFVGRLAVARARAMAAGQPLTPMYLRRPDARPPGPRKAVLPL